MWQPSDIASLIAIALGVTAVIFGVRRSSLGLWLGISAIVVGVVAIIGYYLSFSGTPFGLLLNAIGVVLGAIGVTFASKKKAAAPTIVGEGAGRTNGLALASIIVVWFSSIIGLVLGYVALSQIRRTGEDGQGMATTAVVVGWVFTVIGVIGSVILAVYYMNAVNSF